MYPAEVSVAPVIEPAAVVDRLRSDGIVVLPGFVAPAYLAALIVEHQLAVERARASPVQRGQNGMGVLRSGDARQRYPVIHRIFYAEWMRAVAHRYLGPRCAWQDLIYCTHERRELHPITAPHFDTVQALKFYVYLLDTDDRNGAFRYAAGTHLANAEAARWWREAGGRVRDTPNVATDEEVATLQSVTGPAGTLVVFDSNGFHSGGMLQPGAERRVVRAQSYPRPRLHLYPRRLSAQWFREADWNPLRLARPRPVPSRPATAGNSKVRTLRED